MTQRLLDNVAMGAALLGAFMVIGLIGHTLGEDGTRAMQRFYAIGALCCGAACVVACLLGGRIHHR